MNHRLCGHVSCHPTGVFDLLLSPRLAVRSRVRCAGPVRAESDLPRGAHKCGVAVETMDEFPVREREEEGENHTEVQRKKNPHDWSRTQQ